MQSYIKRAIESTIKQALFEFPALLLTGPRQSGKTTLLKHIFNQTHRYVSLELPDVHAAAAADPRGFLALNPAPIIFDEIQYAPELLPYIKEQIDSNRDKRGRYILTGSQNILLSERVTESLAGRIAVFKLLPISIREETGELEKPLLWESDVPSAPSKIQSSQNLWQKLIRGWYPELVSEPERSISLWHSNYIQTYLERDLRTVRHVGDLLLFQNFLKALAGRSGSLLNLAEISRDLGISQNTIKAWISVLDATFQIIVLRPYFGKVGKRIVKTPKVYFTDTGTLCHLTGLKDAEHAASGPMSGAIFETAIVSEIFKTFMNRGEIPGIYFWRTSTGTEVDIVVEISGKLIPIEIKATSTPRPQMAQGIRLFQKDFGDKATAGYVIHIGDVSLPLAPNITAVPFKGL